MRFRAPPPRRGNGQRYCPAPRENAHTRKKGSPPHKTEGFELKLLLEVEADGLALLKDDVTKFSGTVLRCDADTLVRHTGRAARTHARGGPTATAPQVCDLMEKAELEFADWTMDHCTTEPTMSVISIEQAGACIHATASPATAAQPAPFQGTRGGRLSSTGTPRSPASLGCAHLSPPPLRAACLPAMQPGDEVVLNAEVIDEDADGGNSLSWCGQRGGAGR